jgi:hypothetical protein
VQVKDKVSSANQIDSAAFIPRIVKVGKQEIPTDVESVGDIVAQVGFRDRQPPPVQAGSSIGHPNGETGTFGSLVVLADKKVCILSNNHVLAALNAGPQQVNTLHPGLADATANNSSNTLVIGQLARFVPLNLSETPTAGVHNTVDAAVTWTSRKLASTVHRSFTMATSWLPYSLGMSVMKDGRTTGYTEGKIVGVSADIPVAYEGPNGKWLYGWFSNQLVIQGFNQVFSDAGDSGALVLQETTHQPVGLLFSGSQDRQTGESYSFANPIESVITALGIVSFG